MAEVFRVGERFSEISGVARDEFVAELVRLRDTTSGDLVLDFTGVSAISSIGLAAIGRLHTSFEDQGRRLTIRGLGPHIRQLFEITGLDGVLHIEESAP